MKKTPLIIALSVLAGAALLEAQFGGIVFDPTQNANALRQIAQEVQELAKIDMAQDDYTVTAMPYAGPAAFLAVAARTVLVDPAAAEAYRTAIELTTDAGVVEYLSRRLAAVTGDRQPKQR